MGAQFPVLQPDHSLQMSSATMRSAGLIVALQGGEPEGDL